MLLNKEAFDKIFKTPIKGVNQEGTPARPAGATMNTILKTIEELPLLTEKAICVCSGYKKDTVHRACYWLKYDKKIEFIEITIKTKMENNYKVNIYSVKGLL